VYELEFYDVGCRYSQDTTLNEGAQSIGFGKVYIILDEQSIVLCNEFEVFPNATYPKGIRPEGRKAQDATDRGAQTLHEA